MIRGNLLLFAEKSVDGSGFIFLSGNSKNQGPGLLGTVGGGFWLWKPHRERWILGQFFWSFCELAQIGDSDIFYVRQPYDDGQPK